MKRILLTGMSGNGKSSVTGELRARGYQAIDMDEPGWSDYSADDGWTWNEDRVQEFLSTATGEAIFMSGCASNQVKFYPQLDLIILLSAPAAVLIERLATRTNNPYGQHPDDIVEILGYLETVEPLLRKRAHHEIDTRMPLNEVVETILKIVTA